MGLVGNILTTLGAQAVARADSLFAISDVVTLVEEGKKSFKKTKKKKKAKFYLVDHLTRIVFAKTYEISTRH